MKISDIRNYTDNARRNEKAITKVAESIKQFGLRGSIILESRDNPVIVCGHTRVAAMKLLGWTVIPDNHIEFCDGLTKEQIDAFRLVDNKTARLANWNIALLQKEVRRLEQSTNFEDFGFEFKSKQRAFGAEAKRTVKRYNLDKVDSSDCARGGFPQLTAINHTPKQLIGFNFAKTEKHPADKGVHFFLDDYQFERVWDKPEAYFDLLKRFDSVLTPDFSLYSDMPYPMQQWNIYRSRALGRMWQQQGIRVIPTLSWSDEGSYSFCFNGIPQHTTVAVSTVGIVQNKAATDLWEAGMSQAINRLRPTQILLYGKPLDFNTHGIPVTVYHNQVSEHMQATRKR